MAAVTSPTRSAGTRQVVFLFDEGDDKTRTPELRGGKGANLARMAALGLPVPPGFTVTTTVARAFAQHGRVPKRFAWQFDRGIQALEQRTSQQFGNPDCPLLVSVRSGAAESMPGMMDTVLNVGLNLATVQGLARYAGERFAWDTYRRFLALFGQVVLEIPREFFEEVLTDAKREAGVTQDFQLPVESLVQVCHKQLWIAREIAERPVPDDPYEQLLMAVNAVLHSWTSERATVYRHANNLPDWWGTAVNIQVMVFGNRGYNSGTGVVFSHNVATGQPGLYGEYLPHAQGEDVVAGVRTPHTVADMAAWAPAAYHELERHVALLSSELDGMVDIEFTVENGQLYLLQVRSAKRTPLAAATFAVHQVWAKKWSKEQALKSVSKEEIKLLEQPAAFEASALELATHTRLLARGLAASPGAAVGKIALSSARARQMAADGTKVVLVRQDTSPDDLPGMLASVAIVTATGGTTCHAAVVARELGLPAIVGAATLPIDELQEGQTVSVNGDDGVVVYGELPFAEAASAKEVTIFLKWVKSTLTATLRIRFDDVDTERSANRLLNDFYLVEAMAQAANGTRLAEPASELRNRVHRSTAECLATYLAVAVSGEIRHCFVKAPGIPSGILDELATRFSVQSGSERAPAQTRTALVLQKSDRATQIRFFQLCVEAFEHSTWRSSFGGPAWARISRAVLQYLTGELTLSLFVDHVFDLKHNGGVLFNKHRMFRSTTNEGALQEQLDAKKTIREVGRLFDRLRYHHWYVSQEVLDLFDKGRGQFLW